MRIKPAEGKTVHDPDHGDTLPPEGRQVEPHQYWLRRLADGDVVEVTETPQTSAKQAASAKE